MNDDPDARTSNELTESLCHEGEKDWQIDQLLEYLHYDPETKSHPDWVARAQAAEAEVERLTRERQGWVDTAAEFARNMEYYQGLVDRIGRAIGREAYIADDGSVSQDVLRAKVPEIVERVLSERNQSPSETSDGWQPIETAPKDGRTLLLGYFNKLGNWRSLHGRWFQEGSMDEWDGPDYTNPAGWYETSVENDDPPNCWATEPTHWHPTLRPPEKASDG